MASNRTDESDNYWNSSKASKLKSFGINQFDDDAVEFKDIYKYLNKDNNEIDEVEDVINWDGTSSGAVTMTRSVKSSSSSEALSARQRPAGGSTSQRSTPPRSTSSTSVGSAASGKSGYSAQTSGSRETSPPLSISDVVGSQKSYPSKTQVAKLEAEVNSLRRTVDYAKKDKYSVIEPKYLIKRIITGQPYTMELYKGKADKLKLLDEAITSQDGNAIIAAVLFLRDTVKSTIFNMELIQRPVAIDHYVSYLKASADTNTLMDILGMLGRHEEAAMIKYKQVSSIKDPDKKCKALEACKSAHFTSEPSLAHEASLLQEQILTLGRQMPVEKADKDLLLAGDLRFKQHPPAASIVDQPVITWLFYCCFYHYNLSENNFASPLAIRRDHKLTDKQYLWVAVSARSKVKLWKDVEALFASKTWFKGMQLKAPMGFHRIIHVLHYYKAPRDILNKYCMLIDDYDKRIEVGEKLNCHEAVLETLMLMKDRKQIVNYQTRLKPNSQEWFCAADILRNTSIKWKN